MQADATMQKLETYEKACMLLPAPLPTCMLTSGQQQAGDRSIMHDDDGLCTAGAIM
jgi:hypothetical protein